MTEIETESQAAIDTAPGQAVKNSVKNLRTAAMGLLARREHSRLELQRKLASKSAPDETRLAAVLDRLEQDGLLSDSRFAEAFSNARVRTGKGPVRIRAELRERGVEEQLVERVLGEMGIDWVDQARDVARKRFGCDAPRDHRAIGQRMRFLQYRGFTTDQIRAALDGPAIHD